MKVSDLNPKDNTLDEIHAIQEAFYKNQKNWNFHKLQVHYHRIIKKVSKEMGSEIKTAAPGNKDKIYSVSLASR